MAPLITSTKQSEHDMNGRTIALTFGLLLGLPLTSAARILLAVA